MMKPPIQISLPQDHPALKGCMPGDLLTLTVKTLPGEEGETDSEEEPEGESEIMAQVQSISKAKPAKPKAAPAAAMKPMDYLKGKQTGKKAGAY